MRAACGGVSGCVLHLCRRHPQIAAAPWPFATPVAAGGRLGAAAHPHSGPPHAHQTPRRQAAARLCCVLSQTTRRRRPCTQLSRPLALAVSTCTTHTYTLTYTTETPNTPTHKLVRSSRFTPTSSAPTSTLLRCRTTRSSSTPARPPRDTRRAAVRTTPSSTRRVCFSLAAQHGLPAQPDPLSSPLTRTKQHAEGSNTVVVPAGGGYSSQRRSQGGSSCCARFPPPPPLTLLFSFSLLHSSTICCPPAGLHAAVRPAGLRPAGLQQPQLQQRPAVAGR